MAKKRSLSAILPIYNERENLAPLIDELAGVLARCGTFEIIAVDDGSTDGSADWLLEQAAKRPYLKVISFRGNAGQTAALDAGFRHATGDIVVTLDADRQNDPNDIPRLLEKLDEGYDCVAGWRKNRKDGFVLRRLPSLAANALIRFVRGSKLKDLGCALKVFRREITTELRLYGEMHRFIALLIEGLGAKVTTMEVNHRPRVAGRSKYGLWRTYRVILDLLTLSFLQDYRAQPLHIFGLAGGLCFGGSSLSFGVAVWHKFSEDLSLNRNPLFTLAVSLGVIGVQFIAMGLLAEMLTRNYHESTQRVPYSIRTKAGFGKNSRAA